MCFLYCSVMILTGLNEKMGQKLHELIYTGLVKQLMSVLFLTKFSARYRKMYSVKILTMSCACL